MNRIIAGIIGVGAAFGPSGKVAAFSMFIRLFALRNAAIYWLVGDPIDWRLEERRL